MAQKDAEAGTPPPLQKMCTGCGIEKELSLFVKDNRKSTGFGSRCLECERKRAVEKRLKNPDYDKDYYQKNKDAMQDKVSKWVAENPDARRRIATKYNIKRRATLQSKLETFIRGGIRRGLLHGSNSGSLTVLNYLGYTIEDLKAHLERQFLPGMTWENYGKSGWHIDHKTPLSAFYYQTPDDYDFKRAWALENLQPLWERDNLSKGARLERPFQPSLPLPA